MNNITRQIHQATEALPFKVNHRRFEAEPGAYFLAPVR